MKLRLRTNSGHNAARAVAESIPATGTLLLQL
jgi:hypothetical protein